MNIYEYLASIGQLPRVLRPNVNPLDTGRGVAMGDGLPPAPKVPALQTRMIPGPLQQGPSAPSGGGGFLAGVDRLLGGQAMQGLDPAQAADARRQGLLAAGAQMMLASAPQFGPPVGLPAILAQGVLAGQQGYGQGIEQGYAQQQQARRAALYAELQPKPGETTRQMYDRLQRMLALATQEQDEGTVKSISGVLASMAGLVNEGKGGLKASDMLKGNDGYYYRPDPQSPSGFSKTDIRYPKDADGGALTPYQQAMLGVRNVSVENALNDDYMKEIDKPFQAYQMIDGAMQAVPEATRGNGAAQVQMLYAFVKAMDMDSAVREGELKLIQGALSLKQQVEALQRKYGSLEAAVIPPSMVTEVASVLRKGAARYERQMQGTEQRYRKRAQRAQVDDTIFRPIPRVYYQDVGDLDAAAAK